MTTGDVPELPLIGLHATYPDDRYWPGQVSLQLYVIDTFWPASLAAVAMTATSGLRASFGHDEVHIDTFSTPAEDDVAGINRRIEEGHRELAIVSLQIESPMDLTLALQGGGVVGAVVAVRLLISALRKPDEIGSWFPRLLTGWQTGMADLEAARKRRKESESLAPLVAGVKSGAGILDELGKPEVEAIGVPEPPDDVTELLQERST